jgi:hypothetical protein
MVTSLEADEDGRADVSSGVTLSITILPGTPLVMATDIAEITKRLRESPEEKLAAVYEFVSRLAEDGEMSDALKTMLASEAVLRT